MHLSSAMRHFGAVAILLMETAAAMAQSPAQSPADGPVGVWQVEKGIAHIQIVDCGGKLWGVVSWEAKPGVDTHNPDPALRSRPTLGMPVLLGMAPTQPNLWEGKIYNSEDGRTYSAKIRLRDPATLRVEGCVFGVLCGGENWSRIQPDSSASTTTPSATPPPDDVCSRVAGSAGLSH